MAVIYIQQQGAEVVKRGQRLRVIKEGILLQEWPIIEVSKLVLMGEIKVTPPARAWLLSRGIDVQFHSETLSYQGRLMRTGSKLASLRVAQFQTMSNQKTQLQLAQSIMSGKWHNQCALLQHQIKKRPAKEQARPIKAIKAMQQLIKKASKTNKIEQLHQLDKQANGYYFGAWQVLLPKEFTFTGRAYFPPPDPVNGLLSFCYALLRKDISAMIHHVGLDPYLGFFHTMHKRAASLTLDLMEEFRPIVVDHIVLQLLQQQKINPNDFEKKQRRNKTAILLAKSGHNTVIRTYEERLYNNIHYPLLQQHTSIRRCIEMQTRQLARVILGEAKQYQALKPDFKSLP